MGVPFAIVNHADQYLITEGYGDRHGLRANLGSVETKSALSWVLEPHFIYDTPVNLRFSGSPPEAISWHQPAFFQGFCRQLKAQILGWVATRQQWSEIRGYADPRRRLPWRGGSLTTPGPFCGQTKRR
jgi:hypothetical protein